MTVAIHPVPLRALVIGAGPAAVAMHLPALARLRDAGELALPVVCDIDGARAAAAQRTFGFGVASGDALGELARSDIDVVYVFGSAQMHHELGLRALQSGRHLFIEKPIAPSFAQACTLAENARARGLVAAGGHNRRFMTAFTRLRARGHAGWRFAEAVFHKPEFGRPAPFGADTWLGANGIHALDALLFMMGGLPETLHSYADAGAVFSAVMQWPDRAQGTFLCNNQAGARREEYVFHRPGETCRLSGRELLIETDGVLHRQPLTAADDGVEAEHAAFIAAVRGAGEPVHSIAALAPALYLAELIEAGFSGRVALPGPSAPLPAGAPTCAVPADSGILVVNPAGLQPALARFLPAARLVSLQQLQQSPAARPEITAAILGKGAAPLTAQELERLPNLRILGVVGLSVARHEPTALLARGIRLVNASSAYASSVAEFALALAILGRRRGFVSHETMRAGGWGVGYPRRGLRARVREAARRLRPAVSRVGLEPLVRAAWRRWSPRIAGPAPNASGELRGCAVGLIGWGANARCFAQLLLSAGARVLVYSQHASAAELGAASVQPAALAEVLACEVVSLHRGLTEATRHRLGAQELAQLRPGAVLINVARGALIEPDALLRRLKRGDVFACLDTYEEEPLAPADPLRRLPNVFLTAHIAGGSAQMYAAAAEEVAEKLAAYLGGAELTTLAAERLRTMT